MWQAHSRARSGQRQADGCGGIAPQFSACEALARGPGGPKPSVLASRPFRPDYGGDVDRERPPLADRRHRPPWRIRDVARVRRRGQPAVPACKDL